MVWISARFCADPLAPRVSTRRGACAPPRASLIQLEPGAAKARSEMSKWLKTSRKRRCPICEKPDWCTFLADGGVAHCMRVSSEKAVASGGWIHRLNGEAAAWRAPSKPEPERAPIDWLSLCSEYRAALEPHDIAYALGVTVDSLDRLWAGWAPKYDAVAFPMRDGKMRIVGVRLRRASGRKFAVPGSRNALFIPSGRVPNEVWVCEGPTDCAALLSRGVYAIGRPSNTGGLVDAKHFLEEAMPNRVIVLVDNDPPGTHARASTLEGAMQLIEALPHGMAELKRPPPEFKDAREWLTKCAR